MISDINPNFPTRECFMHKEVSQILISGQRPEYYSDFPRELSLCYWIFHIWLDDLHADSLGITLPVKLTLFCLKLNFAAVSKH